MEFYILCGLIVAYFLTYIALSKRIHKRIWTTSFLVSFIIMGISVVLLRISHHKGISIIGLDEFYVLYLVSMITFLLGVINIWMYKVPLYHILNKKEDDAEE